MASISVILPNYNHARYLPRRIESILGQTRSDFDLLILDDNSPDDSREVIARYTGDPRVRTAFNDQNSGINYRQWQKGISLTEGDYIWIAESDDYADAELLERLSALLDANPKAGLAFCETVVVDTEDQAIIGYMDKWRGEGFSGYDLDLLDRDFTMNGRDYLRDYMIPYNTIPNASAVLFRRSAFEAIGGPVTDLRLCGDWLTYCKMLAKFDIAHSGARMNHFRQHTVNVRSSIKGETLAVETMVVEDWIERELGSLPASTKQALRKFYVQMLLGSERRGAANKTSLARLPAILAHVRSVRSDLFATTLKALTREHASETARRIGLRSKVRE